MEKIEINDKLKLILFHPGQTFSIESVKKYISALRTHHKDTSEYKRFLDLSKIESANFKYPDFANIASLFKELRGSDSDPKACFYYKGLGVEKLSDLFFEKMKPEFKNYYASDNLQKCADYLNLNISVFEEFIT